jgi:hypothetical protein
MAQPDAGSEISVDIKTFLLKVFHSRCVFDSAHGFDIIGHDYWVRCKCGRRRRFKDAAGGDRLLADILYTELGLAAVVEEVDRGL